jgi:hypothetical protein
MLKKMVPRRVAQPWHDPDSARGILALESQNIEAELGASWQSESRAGEGLFLGKSRSQSYGHELQRHD